MTANTETAAGANATLRLYYHPISTTCRPIMLFAAEHGLALDYQMVDLFAGEQFDPSYRIINPNQAVPVLEHGAFRLTESSAILKYLADHVGSPCYPSGARERARVNEVMDWFNTGLSRELAYGVAYPQVLPHYRRDSAEAQAATLAWSQPRASRLLSILDEWMLGPNKRFVLGDQITLADYLGLGLVTLGEVAGMDYTSWPNLRRWLRAMQSRPAYASTHAAFHDAMGPVQSAAVSPA